MKTFKQYLNEEIPSIPMPIHFKHVTGKEIMNEDITLDPHEWIDREENGHLLADHKGTDKTKSLHITRKLVPTVSKDQHAAIKTYTAGKSEFINKDIMRSHEDKKAPHSFAYTKEVSHHLDSAIKDSPIKHDVHTFSGVGFDPEKHMDSKGRMHSPAFISSSHNKVVTMRFADKKPIASDNGQKVHNIIHFHLKKDDPAIHVGLHSEFDDEHETLIKRGVTLQRHKVEEFSHPFGKRPNSIIRVHHMSIVKK